MDFREIVDVIETGKRGANVLLRNGYTLLAVDIVAKLKGKRAEPEAKITAYVQKDFVYVLGRTEKIPVYTLTDKDFE